MRIAHLVQAAVGERFICCDQIDLVADCLTDKAIQSATRSIIWRTTLPLRLIAPTTGILSLAGPDLPLRLFQVAILILAANVGFINLNLAHELRKAFILHRRADSMTHEPSSPVVAASNLPMDLQGANSLLALAHQVDDLEPSGQRVVRIFEDRFRDYREAIAIAPTAILVLTYPMEGLGLERIILCALATRHLTPSGQRISRNRALQASSVE